MGGRAKKLSAGPSSYRAPVQVRFPVLEQTFVQLGGAFARQGRVLTPHEIEIAKPIFGSSIAYDAVRIVKGYFANAPTTLGNHVRISVDSQFDNSTLVHELTHVWQYQTHGTGYISNSLCAQVAGALGTGSRNAAYEIHPSDLRALRSISELSAERQARTVEHYFVSTLLKSSDPKVSERARHEYWYLIAELTDPRIDQAKFDAEFADLERMIAEVRRARPLNATEIYQESLYGPVKPHVLDPTDPRRVAPVMPIFRIEF
jgi:hypothetical protein